LTFFVHYIRIIVDLIFKKGGSKMKGINVIILGAVVFIVIALVGLFKVKEISLAINLSVIIGTVIFVLLCLDAKIVAKTLPKRIIPA